MPMTERILQTGKAALMLSNLSLGIRSSEIMIAETNQINAAFRAK